MHTLTSVSHAQKAQEGKKSELILLDTKRSNAINIGMTKLPPPRTIRAAILKMDSTIISREGIEKILTMIPSEEEKTTIAEAMHSSPDLPLGSAENFLHTLMQVSAIEQRLRLWAFRLDFDLLEKEMGEQLMDLKTAMEEIESSQTFKIVLGTLLKMGNFLNGVDAKGFQLEYLSKVPEVKDTVNKHSLLHHLVQTIHEQFPDATDLYSELGAVTRASHVSYDELEKQLARVEEECKAGWDHLKVIAKHEAVNSPLKSKMNEFLNECTDRIAVMQVVQRRVLNRFKKTLIYLGFSSSVAKEIKPQLMLKVISEFALEYRTTRERVKENFEKKAKQRERNRSRKVGAEVSKPNLRTALCYSHLSRNHRKEKRVPFRTAASRFSLPKNRTNCVTSWSRATTCPALDPKSGQEDCRPAKCAASGHGPASAWTERRSWTHWPRQ